MHFIISYSSASSSEANKHESKINGDKGKKNGGKAFTVNKFTPKPKTVGFSDKQQPGNRKWVMPVGAAFFTGTNAAASAAPSTASAASGKTIIAAPTAGKSAANANGATRIMRPNEVIEEVRLRELSRVLFRSLCAERENLLSLLFTCYFPLFI